MTSPRKVALSAAASLGIALAGCAATTPRSSSTDPELARSAAALDRNAQVFAAHSQDESAAYSADARRLQQQAYDFHDSVESGKVGDMKTDFKRLSQTYQAVSGDVAQLDTTEARTNLQPVTEAYQEVQTRMQGYGGSAAGD